MESKAEHPLLRASGMGKLTRFDPLGTSQNIPYLYKKLSKSRLSDPFFWPFLVISEVGSPDFIMKSAVVVFGVFPLIFLHEITLSAIYIHNIGCSEPFLPL